MTWSLSIERGTKIVRSDRREKVLFRELDFQMKAGDRVAVLGPSGSGKSTLLSVVAGLSSLEGGEVRKSGRPTCAFVFQSDTYLPWRTVSGNLAFASTGETRRVEQTEAEKRRILTGLGLDPGIFLARRMHSLSGGERRRVCLAMALISASELLLLDEANSGLDEITRFSVCDFLIDEIGRRGAALVMVTHDLEEAILVADRFLLLGSERHRFETNPLQRPRKSPDRYTPQAQAVRAQLASDLFKA